MEQHLSRSALSRFFSGHTADAEAGTAAAHLAQCRECWAQAAEIVEELRQAGGLSTFSAGEAPGAVLALLDQEKQVALRHLLARSWWAEHKDLPPEELARQVKRAPALQSREMFETVLAEAGALAFEDPWAAEMMALAAHALAHYLPEPRASIRDCQGKALLAVTNCRRLAGDWKGAAVALAEARASVEQGTCEPALEARLLSIEASLASDLGNLERARESLRRAAVLLHRARLTTGLASIAVQEANSLLAGARYEEAIARAEEALQWLTPREVRLEILAQSLITECLAVLGRPAEALRTFRAALPLYEQFGGSRTDLRRRNLEAFLLDAFGFSREAERAYRNCAEAYLEAELYKDAFLTLLTLFESLVRREAWDKAVAACEEALVKLKEPGRACHAQMIDLWEKLLALLNARRLTRDHLLDARTFLAQHWNVPARRAVFLTDGTGGPAPLLAPQAAPPPPPQEPEPPNWTGLGASVPVAGAYEEAIERCDRQLVAAGLARCGGSITETSSLLGMSRSTLRLKIKKYGLATGAHLSFPHPRARPSGLTEDDRLVLGRLVARSLWAELSSLPARQKIERIHEAPTLQTREMFRTVVSAAATVALEDPVLGEELAVVARAVALALPETCCPEPARHDLLGEALLTVGNCRRLSGDWEGSSLAFDRAGSHLAAGTGNLKLQARLASLRASLASDTGDLQRAQGLLTEAERLYHQVQETAALASIRLQGANAFLAGGRPGEAVARAEAVLRSLTPREARLEMLARSIITEGLARLGRPEAALRSLAATWPLYEHFPERRMRLRLSNLEAYVLDALGRTTEAEAVYRSCIASYLEAELYKDAFLTMLSRFESRARRGERESAARACEEAIALEERLGHAKTAGHWRDLLARMGGEPLAEGQILEARQALVRHWSVPVRRDRPGRGAASPLRMDLNGSSLPAMADDPVETFELPPADQLANGGYRETLDRFEKKLLAQALERTGGKIRPASRLLRMERNALRGKARRYGLVASA